MNMPTPIPPPPSNPTRNFRHPRPEIRARPSPPVRPECQTRRSQAGRTPPACRIIVAFRTFHLLPRAHIVNLERPVRQRGRTRQVPPPRHRLTIEVHRTASTDIIPLRGPRQAERGGHDETDICSRRQGEVMVLTCCRQHARHAPVSSRLATRRAHRCLANHSPPRRPERSQPYQRSS